MASHDRSVQKSGTQETRDEQTRAGNSAEHAATPNGPAMAPITHYSFAQITFGFRKWWRDDVMGTVNQEAVIAKRRHECEMSARYLFMTAMSGGIAILGLLLSSPAVVIGAMLLSPLMDPIMGLGFALAIGDYRWLRRSALSLAWGTMIAVGLCALVVFLSPIQHVTAEIAARTRPNLFDLLVAVFSALAGAYAMIRGREGTIVGVAIATALMPPLAVIGFGLATFNWTVFNGALFLYVTNLMAIALIAALMARLYGFRTRLSEKQTRMQNLAIFGVFIVLAVPLGLSLRTIAWETSAERQIGAELAAQFGGASRISKPEISFDSNPIKVSAYVWTTQLTTGAEAEAEDRLSQQLGKPVDIDLQQFLVSDEKSAEKAQLAAAKEQAAEAASRRATALAGRLALAAGVKDSEVMVDRQHRRAMARAQELPGASLASYRMLEQRIAATEPEWRVELIPPATSLPEIAFEDGKPTADGEEALALIAWASGRIGAPILLTGPEALTTKAENTLSAAGVPLVGSERGKGPTVKAEWGRLGD